MRLSISGIHMDTGPALQAHAQERMEAIRKYFDQVIDVNVFFVHESHHQHLHGAELTVHANGILLRAEGSGIDWHAALDDAASKLERQLDRYKGRLQKHRERRKKLEERLKDSPPALRADGIDFEVSTVDESRLEGLDRDDVTLLSSLAPAVVKKDVSRVEAMTVDEAIMQMDLLHKPAFLFMNAQTGVLNMVYREGDDVVRWVAPKSSDA